MLSDESARRAAFIRSLRELANFLEDNPSIQQPQTLNITAFVPSKEDLVAQARIGPWGKIYHDNFFYLQKSFGEDLTFAIATYRSNVCRRVVKGTKVIPAQAQREVEEVEWVCDEPLLESSHG